MSHFTFANFTKSIAAASLACGVAFPVHARDGSTRLAAQQLDPQTFQQKLLDTRQSIKQQQTTTRPAGDIKPDQLVIDICKKNPNLPQCKLK